MSLINDVRYFHDSFSQNLKWWNTSDFILSGTCFYPLDTWVQFYGLYLNWKFEILKDWSHYIENFIIESYKASHVSKLISSQI